MPPKKAQPKKKKKAGTGATAGGTDMEVALHLPCAPEEVAALRPANLRLVAQLEVKTQELAQAKAECRALQARVAALEAQGQKDAAIIRDMTRELMANWSSRRSSSLAVVGV
jgi:hypothetical protein